MRKYQRKFLTEKYRRLRKKVNQTGIRVFLVLLGAGFAVGTLLSSASPNIPKSKKETWPLFPD